LGEIGGSMGEGRQEFLTDNSKRKTGGTTKIVATKGKSTPKEANEKGGGRSKAGGGGKGWGKNGAERLRREADKRVGRNSEKLADVLTAKALAGDLASAKVLVGLAAGKKPMPERKKAGPLRSLALALEAQPQWQGPSEEEEETDGDA
jgi:hypothetical protein